MATQEKKEASKFQKKIDHVCRVIFLTEEGKPKSATLLYAFCLSVVFVIVYVLSYLYFIDVFENALAAYSAGLRNAAEILLPAVIGSIPCVCLSFAFRERKGLVCAAYAWLAIFFLLIAILSIFFCFKVQVGEEWRWDWVEGWESYRLLMTVMGLPSLSVILCGGGASLLIYRHRNRE